MAVPAIDLYLSGSSFLAPHHRPIYVIIIILATQTATTSIIQNPIIEAKRSSAGQDLGNSRDIEFISNECVIRIAPLPILIRFKGLNNWVIC
jgi:hypothetical protein